MREGSGKEWVHQGMARQQRAAEERVRDWRRSPTESARRSCGDCRATPRTTARTTASANWEAAAAAGESNRDRRPGAGASPEPNAGPPRPKRGDRHPAGSFRRAARSLTRQRHGRRRPSTIRRNGNPRVRAGPLFTGAAGTLLLPQLVASAYGANATNVGGAAGLEISQTSLPPSSEPIGIANAANTPPSTSSLADNIGDASSVPDASPEFRAEMGALLSHYAARIAAARHGLSPAAAALTVKSIMNEQAAALQELMARWQAATAKQRAEKPVRPRCRAAAEGRRPEAAVTRRYCSCVTCQELKSELTRTSRAGTLPLDRSRLVTA
jgi:hypothetical protein